MKSLSKKSLKICHSSRVLVTLAPFPNRTKRTKRCVKVHEPATGSRALILMRQARAPNKIAWIRTWAVTTFAWVVCLRRIVLRYLIIILPY